MSDKDDIYECIICCSDGGKLYRVCSCKTHMHEICFRRVVSEVPSHEFRCAVCHGPYAFDITAVTKSRIQLGYCCIILTVILCTIAPMVLNMLLCQEGSFFCALFHVILSVTSGISFCVFVYFCSAFRIWFGRWCPVITATNTQVHLKLPPPVNDA